MNSSQIKTLLLAEVIGARWFESAAEACAAQSRQHDQLLRRLLAENAGREIEKSRRFLLLFERPVDAVRFGLAYLKALSAFSETLEIPLQARLGIHLGEVSLRENSAEEVALGAKTLEVEGPARATVARVLSLATANQMLMTRTAAELARRSLVGDADTGSLSWREHGLYGFDGVAESLEIFEVGVAGAAPLHRPAGLRQQRGSAAIEGLPDSWQPATGIHLPQRPNWVLESRIGRPAFGDVWLATHRKTQDRRIFKLCRETGDRQLLELQVATFGRLRDSLAGRNDQVQIIDWNLDEEPYFIESGFTAGSNLEDYAAAHGGLEAIPTPERMALAGCVVEAVAAVHGGGEVQGDVRPWTVLVPERSPEPAVRLAEMAMARKAPFGIAERRTAEGRSDALYRAPELGDESTHSDVYALGMMVFQLAVGNFNQPPGPFWRRRVGNPSLTDLIANCLEPDPADRLADATELARRLGDLENQRQQADADLLQQQQVEIQERSELETWRQRAWAGGLIAAALAITLLVLLIR